MDEYRNTQSPRVLRLDRVKGQTGLSRSTIYLRMSEGTFPRQISLGAGARAVGWLESDVNAWLAEQIERSRNAA